MTRQKYLAALLGLLTVAEIKRSADLEPIINKHLND